MKYTAAIQNLGCKVNAYESESVEVMLKEAGFTIVPFSEKADVYIVNTCTVTNIADQKSRQMLHRAKKNNPDALVVAIGCYVQTHADSLSGDTAVDLMIGTDGKSRIVELIAKALKEGGVSSPVQDFDRALQYEMLPFPKSEQRTRAFVKVQDGCRQFCSYCAIPLARGPLRSREISDVVDEVKQLTDAGTKEIVLTGIHLTSYGVDRGHYELLSLIDALSDNPDLWRIRLGSLEPRFMKEEAVRTLAANPKVCPHFHLSLQSGSDATLKRMNRHYTTDEYRESCRRIREQFERPALTTDVIVGFPQESDEEFAESYAFVREIGFYRVHVFKYSMRDGTAAASLDGQIDSRIKAERSRAMLELSAGLKEQFERDSIGLTETVLIEEKTQDGWIGHTPGYLKAAVAGENHRPQELFTGTIGKELRIID